MTKQYRSPVMASIHETAEGLHAAGVMDEQTMRAFHEACLTPVDPLSPDEIRARQLVIADPDIMGGDPVFRGTRLPVQRIATLLDQGSTEADLLEGYPNLTAEMVRLAPLYAAAYPLRGRPRSQPWRDQPPIRLGGKKRR